MVQIGDEARRLIRRRDRYARGVNKVDSDIGTVGNVLEAVNVGGFWSGGLAYRARIGLGFSELEDANRRTAAFGQRDVTVSEAIGLARRNQKLEVGDVLGFGVDVLTDPTTYLRTIAGAAAGAVAGPGGAIAGAVGGLSSSVATTAAARGTMTAARFTSRFAGARRAAGIGSRVYKTGRLSTLVDATYLRNTVASGRLDDILSLGDDVVAVPQVNRVVWGTKQRNINLFKTSSITRPLGRGVSALDDLLPYQSTRLIIKDSLSESFVKYSGLRKATTRFQAEATIGSDIMRRTDIAALDTRATQYFHPLARGMGTQYADEVSRALQFGDISQLSAEGRKFYDIFADARAKQGAATVRYGGLAEESLVENYFPRVYGRDAFDYFAKHPALMQKAIPTDLRSSHAITLWPGMQPSEINKLVGAEIYDPNPASAFLQNQLYINKARANVEHLQRVSELTGRLPAGVSRGAYTPQSAIDAVGQLSPKAYRSTNFVEKEFGLKRNAGAARELAHGKYNTAIAGLDARYEAKLGKIEQSLAGTRAKLSSFDAADIPLSDPEGMLYDAFVGVGANVGTRLSPSDVTYLGINIRKHSRGALRGMRAIGVGGETSTVSEWFRRFSGKFDTYRLSDVGAQDEYLSEVKASFGDVTPLMSDLSDISEYNLKLHTANVGRKRASITGRISSLESDITSLGIQRQYDIARPTDVLQSRLLSIDVGLRGDIGALSERVGDESVGQGFSAFDYLLNTQSILSEKRFGLHAGTEEFTGGVSGMRRFENVPGGIDTFLPTGVYDELNRVRDVRRGPIETMFAKGMAKWKQSVTTIFPAFFTRNITGGVLWQNVLAGVGLRDYRANIEIGINTANSRFVPKWIQGDPNIAKYDLGGDRLFTATEARATMARNNIIGVEGIADLDLAKANQLGIWGAFNRAQEMAMVGSENFLRGPVFLKNLREGAGEAASAAAVKKYHFDYTQGALTDWEERFARPFIPFYRWARSNIPLQTESLFEQPGTFAGLAKYKLSTERENRNRLNRFDQTKAGLFFGDTYIGTELPVADLPGSYSSSDAYFAINPFIKLAEGLLTGRDPVTGRSLDTYHASLRLPDDESGDARYAFTGRAGFIANTAFGRIISAGAEVQRSARGERPWTYTLGHQIGGLTVRDASANVNGFDGYLGVSPTESLGGYTPDVTSSGFSQSYTDAEFHTQFNAHLEDSNRIQANGSGSSRSNDAYFKQRFNIEMREHNRVMARGVR